MKTFVKTYVKLYALYAFSGFSFKPFTLQTVSTPWTEKPSPSGSSCSWWWWVSLSTSGFLSGRIGLISSLWVENLQSDIEPDETSLFKDGCRDSIIRALSWTRTTSLTSLWTNNVEKYSCRGLVIIILMCSVLYSQGHFLLSLPYSKKWNMSDSTSLSSKSFRTLLPHQKCEVCEFCDKKFLISELLSDDRSADILQLEFSNWSPLKSNTFGVTVFSMSPQEKLWFH